ncbi:MAG: hypothetical protein A2283_03395 [Lentisphaerae bacterium RIFOXYA12_FULL_48_11]|nr:MAG: hypothetical protein A2283_03395 [Lentisphaerae bacterium RIFOXYA12_FULL_48_11]
MSIPCRINADQILHGLRIEWSKPKKFHAENCTILYKLGNKMAQIIFPNGDRTRKPIEGKGLSINGVDAIWFLKSPESYMTTLK